MPPIVNSPADTRTIGAPSLPGDLLLLRLPATRQRHETETGEQHRVVRHLERTECIGEELLPAIDERIHQRPPGWRIGAQLSIHGRS